MNLTKKELNKVIKETIQKTDILREALTDDRRKKPDRRTDKQKRIEWVINKFMNGRR